MREILLSGVIAEKLQIEHSPIPGAFFMVNDTTVIAHGPNIAYTIQVIKAPVMDGITMSYREAARKLSHTYQSAAVLGVQQYLRAGCRKPQRWASMDGKVRVIYGLDTALPHVNSLTPFIPEGWLIKGGVLPPASAYRWQLPPAVVPPGTAALDHLRSIK
jgi:hypothetical protein